MTRRRLLLTVAGALTVVVAAGAVGVHLTTRGELDHGKVFTAASGELSVRPGQLFSIEVDEHPSWGDHWTVVTPGPDPAAVRVSDDEYVRNLRLLDKTGLGVLGSGGRHYFVFRANAAGRTEISLRNAPAGGAVGPPAGPAPAQAERHYTVEVRG
ncbi:protease inhibitor I42 family protein [Kitasatospora sp. NPDC047058]|uniref:protease inhibitor I42 family protein n=1 Tax=Kitasatospora sp. NPDC047058 TaxID=3155620 RepID=UPI0033F93D99